mmetsp:Transcript_38135/g.55954  ORF Transcript_38135/g.55954 Transcript_38135/m.55954 type:complete len:358 (-) Transcript_38135:330-1403(-)
MVLMKMAASTRRLSWLKCWVLFLLVGTSFSFQINGRRHVKTHSYASESGTAGEANPFKTELPDSFEDSVRLCALASAQAQKDGQNKQRIVFDTTGGDITYTSLKTTLPMIKEFLNVYVKYVMFDGEEEPKSPSVDLSSTAASSEEKPSEEKPAEESAAQIAQATRTFRVYFPDAGSAALAARDWKMGTNETMVPENIVLDSVTRDQTSDDDEAFMILCPKNSEADDVERLVARLGEGVHAGRPVLLVNPELVNMGVTGYGMAGRRIRDRINSAFQTVYYLRTLEWGALTRRYGRGYSLWQEEAGEEGGYAWVKNYDFEPAYEDMLEDYELANGLTTKSETPGFLNAIADLVNGMQRL